MGTIPAGEFKKGIKVQIDNEPYEMLEMHFVKPGKGQALYRTKLRNLLRGSLFEKTYRLNQRMFIETTECTPTATATIMSLWTTPPSNNTVCLRLQSRMKCAG